MPIDSISFKYMMPGNKVGVTNRRNTGWKTQAWFIRQISKNSLWIIGSAGLREKQKSHLYDRVSQER